MEVGRWEAEFSAELLARDDGAKYFERAPQHFRCCGEVARLDFGADACAANGGVLIADYWDTDGLEGKLAAHFMNEVEVSGFGFAEAPIAADNDSQEILG